MHPLIHSPSITRGSFRRAFQNCLLGLCALAAFSGDAAQAQSDTNATVATYATPTSQVLGGWVNGGNFTIGAVGSTNPGNNWISAESPDKTVDGNTGSKYLLFRNANAGLILKPSNASVVFNRLSLSTANDSPERDPASYIIYGSASALGGGAGTNIPISGLTQIASGTLALPDARSTGPTLVQFANSTAYASYVVVFPTVKNAAITPITQVSEVRLSQGMNAPCAVAMDHARGGQLVGGTFTFGSIGNSNPATNWNASESPDQVLDGDVANKYLIFRSTGAGLLASPQAGPAAVNKLTLWTANDFPERDPASYQVYGFATRVTQTSGTLNVATAGTLLGSGNLTLPGTRLSGPVEVEFINSTAYASYLVVFPAVKNSPATTMTQISELQFSYNGVPAFALPTGVITPAGVTWTSRGQTRIWKSIASSADGTKLAAVVNGGQIYVSNDSGASWTARESNREWYSIASSADGAKLAAVEHNGQIHTSIASAASYHLTVDEDSGSFTRVDFATGMTPGIGDVGQTVSLATTNDNNALFSAQPTIAADGTLSFTPAPNANGSATVTVVATDNVGLSSGAQSFTIQVTSVIDVPVMAVKSTSALITANSATLGGEVMASEATVTERGVVYSITSANATPQVGGTGVTKVSASGTIGAFTVNATSLTGSTAYSFRAYVINSAGTSYSQVGSFTTEGVNNVPAFTLPAGVPGLVVTVAEDSGSFNEVGFATGITPGIGDVGQTVSLAATNNNNVLFTVQPSIAADGTLVFTPAPNANGSATVTVVATDSTGLQSSQSFTITVTSVIDAPVLAATPTSASIAASTATLGGVVTASEGTITERGVLYAKTNASAAPEIGGAGVIKVSSSGMIGAFTVNATGLTESTAYSFRAYATNSAGTSYSEVGTFTTDVAPNNVPTFKLPADVMSESDRWWESIASSADGTKLAAVAWGGQIYTSIDFGTTWTPRESDRSWISIASSADGTKLAAVDFGGQIYASIDSGATWTARASSQDWFSIASSADGTKLAAVVQDGQIYTSSYNLTVAENSGSFFQAFATDITPGIGDIGQTVSFAVTNDNTSLFSVQPTIAADGILSFAPSANARGSATVTVVATDSVGLATASQTFTITVTSEIHAPVLAATPTSASITATRAALGGEVVASEATVTERGMVYSMTSTNAAPQIGGTGVTKVNTIGTIGAFIVNATSLSENTTYSFSAYAISSGGTSYSEVETFTTLRLPTLTPSTQTLSGTYGTAVTSTTAFTPAGVSGTVTYSVSPSLPAGLSLDTGTGVISGTPTAAMTTSTTYTITGTGASSGSATATVALTVAKAPLTVTAVNQSRSYGVENPSFSVTFSGFVNGDTSAVVSGAAGFVTDATPSTHTGTYPIAAGLGTLSAANYRFGDIIDGALTITKAAQTVTFPPLLWWAPSPVPSWVALCDLSTINLAATSSGGLPVTLSLGAGSAAALNGTPGSYSLADIGTTGTGTVTVFANQAGDDNYEAATQVDVTFGVMKVVQRVRFIPPDFKTYGDSPFKITGASTDSALPITYQLIDGPATLNGDVLTINGAGFVVIRAVQAGNDYYEAHWADAAFGVAPKTLTVTGALAADKVADGTTAAVIKGAQLTGMVDGDDVTLINGSAGIFSQSTAGSDLTVTSFMRLAGADADNYTLMQPTLTANITAPAHTHQEEWRFANFGGYLSEADAADNTDPDHDGLNNLLEYALGFDPHVASVIPATLALNGANLEYTYVRSTAAKNHGATYQIEWSDTLEAGNWSTEEVTEQIQSTEGALETVKASLPASTGGKRFLRLQVAAPVGDQ